MYIEALSLDINNISNYTKDDIKNIYKKIALECHPDKLMNIIDINEKKIKIDKFKKASLGYNKALDDFNKYGELKIIDFYENDDIISSYDIFKDNDIDYWDNIYKSYFNDKEAIKSTFINFANIFLNKNNYNNINPSTKIINHSIFLPVSYCDLYTDKKKKIRIFLKGIKKPFNISILCKKEYPSFTRQYIDNDNIEHDIEIKMIIKNSDKSMSSSSDTEDEDLDYNKYKLNSKKIEYKHKIINDKIDLTIDLFISLKDYLVGANKLIKYIDGSYINIEIPSFTLNNIFIYNKGLLGGKLIINIILLNISKINWDNINSKNKEDFLKIIDNIYKN
jgi:DnaJ-class molecular chaperone